MESIKMKEFSEYIFSLFHDIHKNDLEYIYKGNVNPDVVSNILDLAKTNLAQAQDTVKVRSRIYFIMGEGLQNVTRHQDHSENGELDSLIVIDKKKERYSITTGNPIKKESVSVLKDKIEKINNMTVRELRDFARHVRRTTGLSEKGGASLGLIEIAKRSGNKLSYTFKDVKSDATVSYFYFNTEILTTYKKNETLGETDEEYLEHVKNFHDFLNRENILLSFKGDFNQENVLYLLDLLRGQMTESTTTIKMNNILIELLQNIEKHADNIDGITDWKPGIFLIHELDDYFCLTASNYILSEKVPELKESLELVNSLDKKGIAKLYREKIMCEETEVTSQKTGLGIIDMKKKSNNKFDYSFLEINNNYSFFTLQVTVKK